MASNAENRERRINRATVVRAIALIAAILMACFIFHMSSIPGSGLPSNLGFWTTVAHFTEYCVLAVCVSIALNAHGKKFWIVVAIAVAICSCYGVSDELHQIFTPGRTCDVFDWLADTTGAFVGAFVATKIVAAVRKRRSR